jgi:hypothetical protein
MQTCCLKMMSIACGGTTCIELSSFQRPHRRDVCLKNFDLSATTTTDSAWPRRRRPPAGFTDGHRAGLRRISPSCRSCLSQTAQHEHSVHEEEIFEADDALVGKPRVGIEQRVHGALPRPKAKEPEAQACPMSSTDAIAELPRASDVLRATPLWSRLCAVSQSVEILLSIGLRRTSGAAAGYP